MPGKIYLVRLAGGKKYQITMESSDFDSFLFVQDDASEQRKWDDDSGGNLNARLEYAAARDSVYRICAASFDGGMGKFMLKIREIVPIAIHEVGKDGLTLVGTVAATDTKLLTEKNSKTVLQLPAKEFQVRLLASKKYRLAMCSKALDSYYLAVRGPVGHLLAWDDDSGEAEEDALINLEVLKDGVCTVYAASYRREGPFILTIRLPRRRISCTSRSAALPIRTMA